jgi:hypothetical protein
MLGEIEKTIHTYRDHDQTSAATKKNVGRPVDNTKRGLKVAIDSRINLQKSILKRIDDHNSKINDRSIPEIDNLTPREAKELLDIKAPVFTDEIFASQDWRHQLVVGDLLDEIDYKVSEK